jgi:TIR domain-containing protein
MQVFISYAHADEPFVQQLDAVLALHHETWYDRKPNEGLQGGQTWQQRLQAELSRRPVVVVVLSPESVRRESFVENEYLLALNYDADVVPLIIP